jgi:hemerythrin
MSFMEWSAELELGAAEIDAQHRWLVSQTNALYEELSGAAPRREVVGPLLEALVDYTNNHFIAEELLFERHAYPGRLAHKAEHDALSGRIVSLLMRFEAGESVNTEVLELLRSWLVHHIGESDRAYIPHLRAQGAL